MHWRQRWLLSFHLFLKFLLRSHTICQDAQWIGYIKILRTIMQVTRIPNDWTGAVWLSQETGGYGGSRFLYQGGGKHKQSPGIAKAACTALSSAPRKIFLGTSGWIVLALLYPRAEENIIWARSVAQGFNNPLLPSGAALHWVFPSNCALSQFTWYAPAHEPFCWEAEASCGSQKEGAFI